MNLDVFKGYAMREQAQLVWAQGTFLARRYRLHYTVFLFDMGNFFAELWFNSQTKKVMMARGFSNISLLTPYLDGISLSSLGLDW